MHRRLTSTLALAFSVMMIASLQLPALGLASTPYTTGLSAAITGAVCDVTDHGAVADNVTLSTVYIQRAIDHCSTLYPEGSTVVVPRGNYKTASLSLRSNMRFHLEEGAGLYGSTDPKDYHISQQWFGGHYDYNFNSLLSGVNISNVSVTGSNTFIGPTPEGGATASSSIVDGVGWKWWCEAKCMPLVRDGYSNLWCGEMNPNNDTLPTALLPEPKGPGRPRLVNFYNCTGVTLQGFTAQHSPHWTIHLQYSKDVLMHNMTVLSPRSVGNTDGIDPDSVVDMLLTDSYISVGDDGISIKSDNITNAAGEHIQMATRNVTMRRLHVMSRNWCIGSSTFGGVYDILFEDSIIGDVHNMSNTVPWAFKFKSHEYDPGSIENVTVRRIQVGPVGPTPWMYPASPRAHFGAFQLALTYSGIPAKVSGTPYVKNITFEDIFINSSWSPGSIAGLPQSCFDSLTFKNVTFGPLLQSHEWECTDVQQSTFVQEDVNPPVRNCRNNNSKGTCA